MNTSPVFIPVLPESAPFSLEQRSWLNGYLAGLYSWQAGTSTPAAKAVEPLTIYFASQTGGAERAAKKLAKLAPQRGFHPAVKDLGDVTPAELMSEQNVLVIASTYGDGEPPDRARDFWVSLSNGAPRLEHLRFSVLALGDSSYPKFCAFGRQLDLRFAELGATRVAPRIDCDVDWVEPFDTWVEDVLAGLGSTAGLADDDPLEAVSWDRDNPFSAAFTSNKLLSSSGSAKDVRHFEFSLAGSGLSYQCGDAIGVWPENDPALVQEILDISRLDGTTIVSGRRKVQVTLREALEKHFEISRIPRALLESVAERAGQAQLLEPEWLTGRDVVDLLLSAPELGWEPHEFVKLLREIAPRLYSISSSPAAHGESVHLTVSAVRYHAHGRDRSGLCSTFLADRLDTGGTARVFIHENSNFRPPADDVPMIMVGPGTGIAPFRGFLHERRARKATGKTWLFFGDQHAAKDYLYKEELETMVSDGTLTTLDLAWSRDGIEKEYVQHRMLSRAAVIWSWLEAGAAFYVCGDAQRMAKDVDNALHKIVETAGQLTPEQASEYVRNLKAKRRYQRDVY